MRLRCSLSMLVPMTSQTENYGTVFCRWREAAGTDYQDVCITVGQLIDTACQRRLGENPAASPRWPLLQQRFDMATQLETGFWQMGLDG